MLHGSLRKPRGFTLVEMLVVIGIIAVLAALLIPVVQGAIANAQKTRNAQELAAIMMNLERYRSENGGLFPPSFGEQKGAGTTYASMYSGGTYRNSLLYRYLITAYPKISDTDIQYMFNNVADQLDQSSALVFWLAQTSSNPRNPFTDQTNPRKYFDFQQPRLTQLGAASGGTALTFYGYRPPYAKESYFVYMEAKHYQHYVQNADMSAGQGNGTGNNDMVARAGGQVLRPYANLRAPALASGNPQKTDPTRYMNPETYQLFCAGLDGRYTSNADKIRLFPSGIKGLTYGNADIPAADFNDDRDNQADFTEGRAVEDVQP